MAVIPGPEAARHGLEFNPAPDAEPFKHPRLVKTYIELPVLLVAYLVSQVDIITRSRCFTAGSRGAW